MARKPLEATQRKSMTPAKRRAVIERAGVCCEHPGCTMSQSLEIDHIIPLELGGADHPDNCQALCYWHHKEKTKADIKRIAKARRLRKKENPLERTPPKRKIQSKGFNKRLKRGLNGEVVPRTDQSDRPDTPERPPSSSRDQ